MLTSEQQAHFEEFGFVRISGFARDAADVMSELIWTALSRRHNIVRSDPHTWRLPLGLGLQKLRNHRAFQPIGGPALRGALDQLLGADGWQEPKYWGGPLVSFPRIDDAASRPNFHTDYPYNTSPNRLSGALVLAYLNEVKAGAGGTIAVARSPAYVARFLAAKPQLTQVKMKVARQALLASTPSLRQLTGTWTQDNWAAALPLIDEHALTPGSDELAVVELCGQPGDIVIGHPWLLHSTAPHFGTQPRFMTVQRILAKRPSRAV